MMNGNRRNIRREVRDHLINKIIPFWKSLRDDTYGGYYGYMGLDLSVDRKAFKGCVLNSRITWLFASAARLFMDERAGLVKMAGTPMSRAYIDELLDYAGHGYEFLKNACLDPEYGGLFWSVTFDGKPEDTTKHTYNQAFAVYALAAYYDAAGDGEALRLALNLCRIIENKLRDEGGYLESYDREFVPSENEKLSENGVIAVRTMNTLLHVYEAYTEIYRVLSQVPIHELYRCVSSGAQEDADRTQVPAENQASFSGTGRPMPLSETERKEIAAEIRGKLDTILSIFAEKVYNPSRHRQEVFFDHEYRPLIDLISYGHDIETAWLLDRGIDVLEIVDSKDGKESLGAGRMPDERPPRRDALYRKIRNIAVDLTDNIYRTAFDGHSLPEECERGIVKKSRTWWMQAEAMNGFLNGFQHDPSRSEYLDAVRSLWDYICEYVIDRREGSEWFHDLSEDGRPLEGFKTSPIVDQWKCPYHNGRMCVEVIRRGVD